MKNETKIKGDDNTIIQGVSNSTVDIQKKDEKFQNKTYAVVGIIIAIITLLVSIIVGWDNIVTFLNL